MGLVTNFGVSLEFRLEGSERQIKHTLVFSPELTHSSYHACRYILQALTASHLFEIIQQLDTLHCWNDNGRHLSSAEHATFVMKTLPALFPKLLLLTDNRHAAKHGKDTADSTVKFGKTATQRLSQTIEGYNNPEGDMKRLREILSQSMESQKRLTGKSADVEFLWCKNSAQKRTYEVLDFTHMSSSACRKAIREKEGEQMRISEHFRYDVIHGLCISNEVKVLKRSPREANEYLLAETDDVGVCKTKTQTDRVLKQRSILQQIAARTSSDVSCVLNAEIPETINFANIKVGESVVIEATKKRARGRPKRSDEDKENNPLVLNRFWTFEKAVTTVCAIADSLGTNGAFPSAAEFRQEGETYLLNKLKQRYFKMSISEFAEKCKLIYTEPLKRRKLNPH